MRRDKGVLSVAIQGEALPVDLEWWFLLLVAPRSTIDNDKRRVEMPQVG